MFFRKFIKNYAHIAKPLKNMTIGEFSRVKASQSRKIKISLDKEALKAFHDLRTILTSAEVLAFPNPEEVFILTTDASNYAIGGVL